MKAVLIRAFATVPFVIFVQSFAVLGIAGIAQGCDQDSSSDHAKSVEAFDSGALEELFARIGASHEEIASSIESGDTLAGHFLNEEIETTSLLDETDGQGRRLQFSWSSEGARGQEYYSFGEVDEALINAGTVLRFRNVDLSDLPDRYSTDKKPLPPPNLAGFAATAVNSARMMLNLDAVINFATYISEDPSSDAQVFSIVLVTHTPQHGQLGLILYAAGASEESPAAVFSTPRLGIATCDFKWETEHATQYDKATEATVEKIEKIVPGHGAELFRIVQDIQSKSTHVYDVKESNP